MSQFKFDKGRVKIGRYSLSNLALAEAISAGVFFILTIVLGISAWKDFRTYFAWKSAIRNSASNIDPSGDLDVVMANRPEFPGAHELRAKIAVNTNDFDLARSEYQIVQKLEPNSEIAVVGLGILALKEYDKKKQEALLSTAKSSFALAATCADAKIGIGGVMLRQNDLEGAWKQFESALTVDPPASLEGMVDLYIGEGAILFKRGNPLAAKEAFEKARFLNPAWDRGYANIAYLYAKQMSETPSMEREKFKAAVQVWQDFANQAATLYLLDHDTRAYFKEALVTFYDAFGCLALRSFDMGTASAKLGQVRSFDPNSKRPTVNYFATLAQMLYNKSLTDYERQLLLQELEQVGTTALSKHRDLTPRERAVIYQVIAARYVIDGSNVIRANEYILLAEEQYALGGEEDHLWAMIQRMKCTSLWKSKEVSQPGERPELTAKAVAAARASLKAEQQADLEAWLKAIENQ